MLPGVLAGQYTPAEMEIDLVRLCNSANARLILDEVVGLDQQHRRLEFAHRPPLHFEVLSVGIGSHPTMNGVTIESPDALVPVKPMQTFLHRLRDRLHQFVGTEDPVKISIVGGGVGSIEVALCLERRLSNGEGALGREWPSRKNVEISLVTGGEHVGNGLKDSTREKIRQQLDSRGISVRAGHNVTKVSRGSLTLENNTEISTDLVLWSTSAVAPPLLAKLGLETDSSGLLLTHPTLQTVTNDHIFAVGDTGTIQGSKAEKAGVFAVRQGPVLWNNINRMLWHPPLEEYHPQSDFLKLINTGDGQAIAEFKGFSFHSRWAWKLKDRIDSRFMAKYQDYRPMKLMIHQTEEDDIVRCLGCGGKIGSELLGKVLGELKIPPHEGVVIGLEHPDDAAIIKTHDNRVTVTTDFFASPFDDPYLVGRIALLNSASDCCVMGAQPTAALAMVQLPLGHPRSQLRMMRDLMAGGVEELSKMGATIVGGHSIEGPRLTIGYTILGRQLTDPNTKGLLRPGDRLILTKPLGSGVLLAALMQSQLPGSAYQPLLDTMLQSNIIALRLVQEWNVSAITDVTGFGLAGHLAEMLQASRRSATLEVDRIPLLPLCQTLIGQGIESTLAPDNRLVAQKIDFPVDDLTAPNIASLFDPQTSGGLLFGIAPDQVEPVLQFLRNEGFAASAMIGQIAETDTEKPGLRVV